MCDCNTSSASRIFKPRENPPMESAPHYAWAGCTWIGIPAPVREAAAVLAGRRTPAEGCGCLARLKNALRFLPLTPAILIELAAKAAAVPAGRLLLVWWAIVPPGRDARAWLATLMAEPAPAACKSPEPGTVLQRSMELPDGFKRPDLGAIVRGGGDVQTEILKAYQAAGARVVANENGPNDSKPHDRKSMPVL